ncbi:MAG TPA: Asp-tRNA(Asn)/Glu-tRNA(Gln) amidotransferase subunit GatA [Polyangiaceae bacterium]|nr:Asp-tRNA(Asn)/Glu-tRNA(Gln) amidotransferase subunit GatA [Polyangiaceae bacterium]
MSSPLDLSIPELVERVRGGQLSAEEVTRASLARIEATRDLGAFLHVAQARALETAREIDQRRARGAALGPLAGVPIAIKDALCTKDAPTTAGSRILTRNPDAPLEEAGAWQPPYDATVIERLRRADAVLVGKANMDEFAMGSSNENSAFFPARNPWDPTRIPGGSSGGSAVAVASGAALGSLGSDTGGSIRQPAGLCGVVGVKPTYGRVSRYGLLAFASSLDQVGPMARDVRGAARLLEVIAGADELDSTCARVPVGSYEQACERGVRGLRLGVPRQYFEAGLDPELERATRSAIQTLAGLGCEVSEVDMPHTKYGVSTYYLVATAEASSNLSRFDGVRFGLRRDGERPDIHAMYRATRGRGFGTEVKRRIMLGTYALSAGYYDAYYAKAQRVRTLIARDFAQAFQKVDLLAAPIMPTPAFRLGERLADPLAMYLADIYTLPASLAGVPGLNVPLGTTEATPERPALPIGLQLMASHHAEETLFAAAAAWEAARPLRVLRPPERH